LGSGDEVILEHIVYATVVAVLVGIVYIHYTGRNPTWIILIGTVLPDIDAVFENIAFALGLSQPYLIYHGTFHNITAAAIICSAGAYLLTKVKVRFWDGFICLAIGFAVHLFADWAVYKPGYQFLMPFSNWYFGARLINYAPNFHGAWMSRVMIVGFILLGLALGIKWALERQPLTVFITATRKRAIGAILQAGMIMSTSEPNTEPKPIKPSKKQRFDDLSKTLVKKLQTTFKTIRSRKAIVPTPIAAPPEPSYFEELEEPPAVTALPVSVAETEADPAAKPPVEIIVIARKCIATTKKYVPIIIAKAKALAAPRQDKRVSKKSKTKRKDGVQDVERIKPKGCLNMFGAPCKLKKCEHHRPDFTCGNRSAPRHYEYDD
jgi:hypothetical protein